MTSTAPRSSAIANAARKTRMDVGSPLPSKATAPRTKAISVAMGIPQPTIVGLPRLKRTYTRAGTIIPPRAAATGRMARLTEESSPARSSRFISRPTTKKKIAIRPSLIQRSSGLVSAASPMPMVKGICQVAVYASLNGEFANTKAVMVARIRSTPAADSVAKKALKGRDRIPINRSPLLNAPQARIIISSIPLIIGALSHLSLPWTDSRQ